MELNNFEQQAKEKLSNREIAPSAQAWDRLDAMLSVQEKPKKKNDLVVCGSKCYGTIIGRDASF